MTPSAEIEGVIKQIQTIIEYAECGNDEEVREKKEEVIEDLLELSEMMNERGD